ncbi:MFS transporter-like protein [Amylocarpus encephaloides]|uniref:MFS transporter-like protein n=1 Tax=Amylocarpus encephaloides TaxID=45428 RepID=A0A9P7YR39_9HELO|nr:MFS transporter-like protein [Amylocarpus encephaloides]
MASITGGSPRGDAVFVVTTTTFVLATLFVISRLISRFVLLKHRTWDDWFVILAWFIAFGMSFAIDWSVSKGLGRRDVDIPDEWRASLQRSEYAFTILYNPALMATKTSILIFYLRMSRNTQSTLRIASYVTLGIVNVAGVVLTFMNAFQCNPPTAAYDPRNMNATCISIITLYLCSAPVNIFVNLAILVLPLPVLTGMRLPQRQKTVLVFTFALGIFVTIVDVVRIFYLQQASTNQLRSEDSLGTTIDFAFNASTAFLWSAVEVNVGIICACIPTMKPLVKKILPAMITDPSRSRGSKDVSSSSQAEPHDRLAPVAEPEPLARSAGALPHAEPGADPENEMGMMDFLTTPETGMRNPTPRTQAALTPATDNTVYFGLVNMQKPKSMLKLRGWECFKYCTAVTILFFLWGFSYGLLNTLNSEISRVSGQSTSQTLGLLTAYFGAYLFGSLTVGQLVLRRRGFKATFITGLCIYGTGTLMFWPCAVLTSFPGFIISNFVVGFGLAVLETAANPFLALCGPPSSAEFRLLLAQGVQASASVLSKLLAQKVLFDGIARRPSLIDVQWAYLAVALFSVMLALFFCYMPLPEATDADLQRQSDNLGILHEDTVYSPNIRLIYLTLGLAVFGQFCYVSAQESMSIWIGSVLDILTPASGLTLTVDNYILVGHATFAIGRFMFAPLCLVIKPRILLLLIFIGNIVLACLTMALHLDSNGIAGPAIVFYFFEGPVWPMIFAMGLRGLGKRTKIGAALLTASASGGAVFPFIMWAVQRLHHHTVQYSYCVIVALYAFGVLFPMYLLLTPKAKRQIDPPPRERRPPRPPNGTMKRRLRIMIDKLGSVGAGKGSPDLPMVEHREGQREGSWESDRRMSSAISEAGRSRNG